MDFLLYFLMAILLAILIGYLLRSCAEIGYVRLCDIDPSHREFVFKLSKDSAVTYAATSFDYDALREAFVMDYHSIDMSHYGRLSLFSDESVYIIRYGKLHENP